MTDYERHQLKTIYEEATSRPRNSVGAWHTKLVEYLLTLGYPTSEYPQAKSLAERLLFGNEKNTSQTIVLSLADKGE